MSTGRYFIIRSRLNDMVLTVDTSGAKVVTRPHRCTWPANQLWFEEHVTGTIRSKFNGYCLDISRPVLQVAPYKGGSAEQDLLVDGQTVSSRRDFGLVLDIIRENKAEGAEVCIYQRNGQSNQHWTFEYGPPQYFTVRTMSSGDLLTAGGPALGAPVLLSLALGRPDDTHQWYEDRFGIIRSKLNSFALDSSKGTVCLNPYDACCMYQQYSTNGNNLTNRHDAGLLLRFAAESSGGGTVQSGRTKNQENERWIIKPV